MRDPAVWIFVVGLGLVCYLLLRRAQRHFARQSRGGNAAAGPARPAAGAEAELTRWEVKMRDLEREVAGRLDSKMAALGHLINEAERAAARLEEAIARQASPRRPGDGDRPG